MFFDKYSKISIFWPNLPIGTKITVSVVKEKKQKVQKLGRAWYRLGETFSDPILTFINKIRIQVLKP